MTDVRTAAQIALTVFILFLVVFFLGFVADPIMGLYYDPSSFITEGLTGSAYDDVYDFEDEGPETWVDHFLKGFASLGLISFLKVLFASPFYWLRSSGFGTGGRRAGTTGRDRMANVSWLIVVIGVITFLVVSKRPNNTRITLTGLSLSINLLGSGPVGFCNQRGTR